MKLTTIIVTLFFTWTSFRPAQIHWVAIGDSITYLNDHRDETGNRVTSGYMSRVVEKRPGISYSNQGHNGWTAGNIAAEIEKLGIEKADVYSIFLGTNDWWQGRNVGSMADYINNTGNNTFYGSLRLIINKIRSLNQEAQIILITPMQRVDFVYIGDSRNNAFGSYRKKNGQSLAQFSDAIINIGRHEHIIVIDLFREARLSMKRLVKFKRLKNPNTGLYQQYPYPDFIDIPFDPLKDEYPYPSDAAGMTYDGLHPSDKGYTVIAERLLKVIKNN